MPMEPLDALELYVKLECLVAIHAAGRAGEERAVQEGGLRLMDLSQETMAAGQLARELIFDVKPVLPARGELH